MVPIILASGSVYRQAQLRHIGIDVNCIAANIDESACDNESPLNLAIRLSREKARKVAAQYPSYWIIGCDQVASVTVDDNNHILGKPGTTSSAIHQLSLCVGREVTFYSAITLYRQQDNSLVSDVDITRVMFRDLTHAEIERYVIAEQPLDSAGSFKVEGKGILLFEHIHNNDPSGLVGLPLILLRKLFTEVGIDLLSISCQNT